MSKEQARQDNDNYWHAVEEVAERIVDELTDAEEDRNELLHRLLHENTDQNEYVINDGLQVHTLFYSKHPCAAFSNGILSGHSYSSTDNFPFAAFAAEALELDVAEKVRELDTRLKVEGGTTDG